ncbi:hypothetical protein SAMN05444008_114131 [Cnuella takakiae]|uniref:Uncharacterized protein n=1 Tax=Cnuella takakiae TaxID=1302690 RepID=A0A1M5FS50_9BACT|nr:hypothetical protein [Cnuella takakiae]OLY93658.1 hypothetical protein BUE76_18565 [Cnuella takakiae]SHF94244.1 hypothetical protein SAMN05444008_114131 [Cnuella takakiae]
MLTDLKAAEDTLEAFRLYEALASSLQVLQCLREKRPQFYKRFNPRNLIPRFLPFEVLAHLDLLTQKFTFDNTFSASQVFQYPLKNTFDKTTFKVATPREQTFNNDFNYCATIPTFKPSAG